MTEWMRAKAPIRLKLRVAFGSTAALIVLMTIAAALTSGWTTIVIGAVLTLVSLALGSVYREVIAGPYVTTVVRMEALAAGDLGSSINFTHYEDCVGRISRAMLTFRDAALREQTLAAEQNRIVHTLAAHLGALAEGDLTARITVDFPNAYGELKHNFNEASATLTDLIGAVAASAISIQSGSGEIASASEDLALRTARNAASLQESAASLAEVDRRLKATAVAASRTVERADQAIATVGEGRAVADEAVGAMTRVSESAKGIDSVIEGLDKIAFQTRVLAMNAAVEAGRAGEAGRGFAVVADLVSALAMRAEEEAKRARNQLTVTQTDIITAVGAVRKVDGALAEISGEVGQVHELLGTMGAENQAQSSAITQISAAIGTMDQSTQQIASMVEETSSATRNLTSEVAALTEQTARFHVGQNAGVDPARLAPRALDRRDQVISDLLDTPTKPLPSAVVSALVRRERNH